MSIDPSANSSVAPSSDADSVWQLLDELSIESGQTIWTAPSEDNRMALWEIVTGVLKTYRDTTGLEVKGQLVRVDISAERGDPWAVVYPLAKYDPELETMKQPSGGPSWRFDVTPDSVQSLRVIRSRRVSIVGIEAVSAEMGGYTCLKEGPAKDGAAFVMRIDK